MNNKSGFAILDGVARNGMLALAAAVFLSTRAGASTDIAAGATAVVPGAPTASAAAASAGAQSVTYKFSRPAVAVAADGIADIWMPGIENSGAAGAPSLPRMAVRIAIPQGKTVTGVKVVPMAMQKVASGVTLRHAEKPVRPMAGAAFAPTPRDEGIYASDAVFPAEIGDEGRTAWKNGVAFHDMVVTPVYYKPASGEVGYYPEIVVTVEYAATALRSASGASSATGAAAMSFVPGAARRAAVAELVDNPSVVSAYRATPSARRSAATEDSAEVPDGLSASFAKPELPCKAGASYQHVVITGESISGAALSLVMYRRQMGVHSTLVTVEDILKSYAANGGRAATIREFIRDAYKTWGVEYVVLAGDTSIIPVRGLHVEAGEDADDIPSDLYYQCLDGDFDSNGNGIYGETGDGPNGGMPDLYAEVKIGRVSAEDESEFRNWFEKMKKYDADAASGAPYTRGAVFAGEHLGPYPYCVATPLMEQIRLGTEYTGDNDGYTAWGFKDVPELFDEDRFVTLYDEGEEEAWDSQALAEAIVAGDGVSVVNHMGHSNYDTNMRFTNDSADSLANENPVFVYSQGCIAGALDRDCIAEHFTTSTKYGAFAGVWNSRFGWYQYGATQVSASGPSQRYHRRFWDAVFRDGHRELGFANMLSHERNASLVKNDPWMRWCYYETNLFGDPIQQICGPENTLSLDRAAYRSDATMFVTYTSSTETNAFTALVTVYCGSAVRATTTLELPLAGIDENLKFAYTNSIALADLGAEHDDTIVVSIAEEMARAAEAYVDDVAPAFTDVSVRNIDDGVVAVSWTTYSPDKSDADAGKFVYEDTVGDFYMEQTAPFAAPDAFEDGEYATTHYIRVSDVENGLYFVRILAADKAGNTNVWDSAEATATVAVADVAEYGTVIVAPRAVRASWDMERDTAGWTTDATGCWQLGTPTYGPDNASRCWGTVLDGRYPDGANATLVSPPVTVRSTPSVIFRHWHDIEASPIGGDANVGADYGAVEVMALPADGSAASGSDGVWVNAAQFASEAIEGNVIQGASDGWESVRILLPADFENKTIRVRFRFVSDTYPRNKYPSDYPAANVGNPAGWYIDGVQILDVPNEGGTVISAQPAAGDALAVKPGETTQFRISTFNVGMEDIIPVGAASVSVSASGVTGVSGAVSLVGGSPAQATYSGAIGASKYASPSETFSLAVAESTPAGTAITVSQSIPAADGKVYTASTLLRVSAPTEVSGKVLQPTGNPVVNATVTVNASDGEFTCATAADGSWSIGGLASNSLVRVNAAYGLTSGNVVAVSPADDIDFTLPLAELHLSKTEEALHAISTNDAFAVTSFVISNSFELAAADGNVGPSASLDYEVTGHLDANGNEPAWFHLANPAGSIAPDASETLDITITPSAAEPGAPNAVTLTIRANGWNSTEETVEISLDVWDDIQLEAAGATGTDIITDKPDVDTENIGLDLDILKVGLALQNTDFDGALEDGEFGLLTFSVRNPSPYEEIVSFEGEVKATSGAMVVHDLGSEPDIIYPGANIAKWRSIQPESAAECADPVPVVMSSGIAEFLVTGWARHGSSSNWQEIAFSVTNDTYSAATGVVQTVSYFPANPVDEVNPVRFARVSATDADGNVFYSNYTPSNGLYHISGLVPGTDYWLHTEVQVGSTAVPPFGHVFTATAANYNKAITGSYYGESSGHLALDESIAFDDTETGDGDGFIDNGETIRIYPFLTVDSPNSVNAIRGVLTTPPAFERAACMDVVAGNDDVTSPEATWLGQSSHELVGETNCFEVTVSQTAVDGDYQRFLLEVFEDTTEVPVPKHWYFDFAIKATPRYTLAGTALAEDGAPIDGVEVSIKGLDDGSKVDDVAAVSAADGSFMFSELPAGQYEIVLSSMPEGYVAQPAAITNTIASADVSGVAFVVKPWGVNPGGDGYDSGSGSARGAIDLTVAEGQAATATFTLTADATATGGDVEVAITYSRTTAEVLSRDEVEASLASARASLSSEIGSNWTALDPEKFSAVEYEFVFTEDSTVAERDAYLARRGLVAKYHFRTIPAAIAVPGATTAALANTALSNARAAFFAGDDADILVSAQPSVQGAVANAVTLDGDPLAAEQWALSNKRQTGGSLGADIGALDAWNYAGTTGSRDVLVAVTDTGVFYNHPDLIDNWSGLGSNYYSGDGKCTDDGGHGTHCAGIIGAVGGNGIGVAGVNWKVRLMSQRISERVMGRDVFASSAAIAQSYEDAYLAGAAINNNSWGGAFYSDVLYRTMKKAQEYGMLFVCAAGNEASDLDVSPNYPASMAQWLDNVIVVAASDHDGRIASFSNYSPKHVHLAAPGVDILSAGLTQSNGGAAALENGVLADGNYVLMSGTSMAAPYVSGAAAFLKAVSPTASYGFIRDAILGSVRVDPLLADYVSTSGHLDLAMAVRLLGANWLRFGAASGDPLVLVTNVTISAGQTVSIPLLVNDKPALRAGSYSATITVSGAAAYSVPVTLTVTPAAIATVASADVVGEAVEDGLNAHDEDVTLAIAIRNAGSTRFTGLEASLLDPAGSPIAGATWNYGRLTGLSTSEPGEFAVTLPSTGVSADYTLVVTENGTEVARLPVSIPLFNGSLVAVTVQDASGNAVEGAEVEIFGGGAARGVTDATGLANLVAPAAVAGPCTLRVTADGFVRHEEAIAPATAAAVTVTLSNATIEPETETLALSVPVGMSLTTDFVISATTGSGAALPVSLALAPRAKIAVFDDQDNSGFLVERLRGMGFDVSYFPDNYICAVYNYGPRENSEIVQAPRYTWDDAALLPYDAIIVVPSGTTGAGRLVAPLEQEAFETYVAKGGRLIFSGVTPLATPDNVELAALAGLSPDACTVADVSSAAAIAGAGCPGAPFVALAAGDAFPADSGPHDASTNATFISGAALAVMDDADAPVARIYASAKNELGGQVLAWNGNASGWQRDGAALDILRGYLFDEFYKDNPPEWIALGGAASAISIADGATGTVTLTANRAASLGVGTYEATLLLVADTDGAQCTPVAVTLSVEPPELRAYTTGTVTDVGGRPLRGDGSDGSCLLQLIYAGPDGTPDPAGPDGSATGDDIVLAASDTLLAFSRFGKGIASGADSGQFDVLFNLAFEGYADCAEIPLFVRAWDDATFATAVTYGDSDTVDAALSDAIDFGSWSLTNVIADAMADFNGDGIPDAWAAKFRPDLDQKAAVSALDTGATLEGMFETTEPPNSTSTEGSPARVFATDKFVFVLEQFSHRIAVHDRATGTNLFYYGAVETNGEGTNYTGSETSRTGFNKTWAMSAANGGFKKPQGLALDTFSGGNRFAVADTENNRVQLFTFDTGTGEITFVSAYGTASATPGVGAEDGTFTKPQALTFAADGTILVADTDNFRVAQIRYNAANDAWTWVNSFNFTDKDLLAGISYGEDTDYDGFWVANRGQQRQRISFHRMAGFSADPVASLGAADDGEFDSPRDVQVWTFGSRSRIVVADTKNSRVRLLDPVADASGNFTGLVAVADIGYYGDPSLEEEEKVWLPEGVFPVAGENCIYVADTGHHMVKWFSVTLDADGDGIDDLWEDANGLDSTVNDADTDTDGDGLSDYAEYLIGSDPANPDSDGDGYGDYFEMLQGADPLDDAEVPEEQPVNVTAITADPAQVAQGDSVAIAVTFDAPATNGLATFGLYDVGDSLRASGYLVFAADGLSATGVVDTASFAPGAVNGVFTFAGCDPPTTNVVSLFTVLSASEETETVPWHIDSFTVSGSGAPAATVGWTVPSASLPASGDDLEFRLDFRSSLTTGAWDETTVSGNDPIKVPQSEAGTTHTHVIDLTNYPTSGFFRLWWLNKVK